VQWNENRRDSEVERKRGLHWIGLFFAWLFLSFIPPADSKDMLIVGLGLFG
jgi:hypothetical protein